MHKGNKEAGYYNFSSGSDYNCYTEQEIAIIHPDFYLDKALQEYVLCNSGCKTCYGPTDENCLSCKNDNYLYKGKCYPTCPKGTFDLINSNGNKTCEDCYQNCGDYIKKGNSLKMMCTSCPENSIIYKPDNNDPYSFNCYKIFDNDTKSFYSPESDNEISSCFELIGKYIKEDSNECINMPESEYFVSNVTTGLLKQCQSSCLTCSKGATNDNPNCDSCKYGKFSQEGKCVTNCQEGYYLDNNNKCLSYNKNCKTCIIGPLTDLEQKILNMKCIECKNELIEETFDGQKSIYYIQNEDNCFPVIIYDNLTIIFNIS